MKVVVNRDNCIGCGACEASYPEMFQIDDEGLSTVISNENIDEAKLAEANKEAEVILQEARKKAQLNEERILKEAKEEASQIRKRAFEEAQQVSRQAPQARSDHA